MSCSDQTGETASIYGHINLWPSVNNHHLFMHNSLIALAVTTCAKSNFKRRRKNSSRGYEHREVDVEFQLLIMYRCFIDLSSRAIRITTKKRSQILLPSGNQSVAMLLVGSQFRIANQTQYQQFVSQLLYFDFFYQVNCKTKKTKENSIKSRGTDVSV